MAQTIKIRRGPKATLPTLGVGEPALTTDSREFYIGTSAGNKNFSVASVRGSDITVASTSWTASGSNLTVTINDAKVPAEDSSYEYQVNVFWSAASIPLFTGSMITETTASGGSYKLTLVSDTRPSGSVTGQVVISRISKAW